MSTRVLTEEAGAFLESPRPWSGHLSSRTGCHREQHSGTFPKPSLCLKLPGSPISQGCLGQGQGGDAKSDPSGGEATLGMGRIPATWWDVK